MSETQHTAGAIRAAEIITGGEYVEGASARMTCENCGCTYATKHGAKTVEGIADLIDNETAAPDMLAAFETFVGQMSDLLGKVDDWIVDAMDADIQAARAAIAKATTPTERT